MEEKNKKYGDSFEKFLRPMTLTVKVVVVRDDGKVLLLKRSDSEIVNKNKLDLPGGHLEEGETFYEGIEREVLEETGLEVEIEAPIKISEYPKENKLFDKIKALRFIAFCGEGEVKLNKKEHSEFFWLEIDEAIEKISDEDGFEKEKKETLVEAKKYLEMKKSVELRKRTLADFENYKKRMAKEKEEFRKYCLENFILELLPVIDNFEMAIEHVSEKDKNSSWMTGIFHIKNQIKSVVESEGVKEIEVKEGDEIDENVHTVISGEGKKGKVKKVLKAGYKMGERVIRPASIVGE